MAERKIIFECRVGSHLYGTNTARSDEDFLGIFLPSTADLLSPGLCPVEWVRSIKISEGARNTAGDIDRKFWSLQRFIELAGQGQPGAIELFFAPPPMVTVATAEWHKLKAVQHLFLARNSIVPFLRFAAAQAHKASLKGENLAQIRTLIGWLDSLSSQQLHLAISEVGAVRGERIVFQQSGTDCPEVSMQIAASKSGAPTVTLAGRHWDLGARVKWLREGLAMLESKYGSRSELAARSGQDWKSLSHAYRLIYEAQELLTTGHITLPLPHEIRTEIMMIKNGGVSARLDFRQDLQLRIGSLTALANQSPLPPDVDSDALARVCQTILLEHIQGV